MSGNHTATGQDHPEPAALAPEGHREARELTDAALEWQSLAGQEWDGDGSARDFQPRPHGSYHEDLECHDENGSGYVLPRPLLDHRIAHMVKALSERLDLHADHDELSTAVQAVTRAVSDEAARLVAERHPDEAVEVEYALWGTPALRYDGTDAEQAALYEKGIPEDSLLNTAVTATPGGIIAVNSIRAQRAAAAAQTEQAGQDQEKTNTLPGHTTPARDSGLSEDEIAQIRALQAASFPTSPGTHQPRSTVTPARAAAGRTALTAAAERGHGR